MAKTPKFAGLVDKDVSFMFDNVQMWRYTIQDQEPEAGGRIDKHVFGIQSKGELEFKVVKEFAEKRYGRGGFLERDMIFDMVKRDDWLRIIK
jgi:hypothetical protein